MSFWHVISCYMLICLFGRSIAYAQADEISASVGTPPARVYLPKDYDANSQNFAFTQDRRGVLYVANFAGVLEYDGINWRTITTQNTTKVSALLTARDGTVYVGGNGEFGFLRADSTGKLGFSSLSQRIKTRFSEIISILETKEGIHFISRKTVFLWNGRNVVEWPSTLDIMSAFGANQAIYVFLRQQGLSRFQEGKIISVGRSSGLPTIYDMPAMLPLGGDKQLLVTSNQGLFQLVGNTISEFPASVNTYLAKSQATTGAVLTDGSLAISTVRGGLVILSPGGQLKQLISGVSGLNDQLINSMYTGRDGNLWLALNNGLAQVEIPSPITLFHESTRLSGEILDIRRVNGIVYLATINGLFRIDNTAIHPIAGLNVSCFSLAEHAGSLFIATSKGVYQLTNGVARALTDSYALCITASTVNPSRLYVGTESGLGVLTSGRYQSITGLNERIFGILEDADGTVWMETSTDGIYTFQPKTNQITHYTTQQGLPTLLYNRIARTSQGLLVCNEKGIYRFNPQQNRFALYNPFGGMTPATHYWLDNLFEDAHGDIWTVSGDKKGVTLYKKNGATFTPVVTPFLPLLSSPVNVIYPDQQGLVWFGRRDGIVRYDAKVNKSYKLPFQALIRKIQTKDEKVLFNGFLSKTEKADTSTTTRTMLDYQNNDISFEFSAASFAVTNALSFQYMLENYDQGWSEWTAENRKEYTNLPHNTYRFRVRARNIYGTRSDEASYSFRILPPWYEQWWVISLFILVAGLIIYGLIRWRLLILVKEKETLENLIQERTEEVVVQKVEMEKQSEELAVKNDQLKKIDLIVQSINAEIDFANLFQTVVTKFSVIRNMDSASFLLYDKPSKSFKFKALRGNLDLKHVESVQLTQEEAESRFLTQSIEVYKDIYLKNDVVYERLNSPIDDLITPRSLITIVIETDNHIEGFITLENTNRVNAFDERDISMICNLKEHLIAAFIKTRLLEDLETTLNDLKNTQDELIRQERLASVGQLTKGIVDRILNPLNYVNNFSQTSDDLINELIEVIENQKDDIKPHTLQEVSEELAVLKVNLAKIQEHSNSTTRILKDMQKLLKEKSRVFLETDVNNFIENKAKTALLNAKTEYKDFSVNLVMDLESKSIRAQLLPYEFGQVIENIVSNSFYTLYEKNKSTKDFVPEFRIDTTASNGHVEILFRDNGKGIPQREIAKLFSPFFTTKPTSKGTGLGLFMARDIIETHKGKIEIHSQEGEFTEILMTLPTISN